MQRLGLPASLWWFVITAVVFALQVFPIPGIFLMMLAAPFWSVLTINVGFLSLTLEALNGRINRLWLAAPIAWFAGYTALTFLSHAEVWRLEKQFIAANAAQHLAFDGNNQTVVFPQRTSNLQNAATELVKDYDVLAAYQETRNDKAANYIAYRLVPDDLCAKVRSNSAYRETGIWASTVYDRPIGQRPRNAADGVCVLRMPEEPQLEPLFVSEKIEDVRSLILPYQRVKTTIKQGTQGITLLSGRTSPLTWLPLPVMGCYLLDSPSSWNCVFQFSRTSVDIPKSEGNSSTSVSAVAEALGLKYAPAGERIEAIKTVSLPDVGNVLENRIRQATATIDSVIANPAQRITLFDVPGLNERPNIISPRAEKIGGSIRGALDTGFYETANVLQDLLATLPSGQFDPVAQSLLSGLKQRAKVDYYMVSEMFAARLGDFGADATRLLEHLAFDVGGHRRRAALVGLCRSGPVAAPLADRINHILMTTPRGDDSHEPAFVALLRIGRRDLAESDPHADSGFRKHDYENWLATITPESPASVCDTFRLFPHPDTKG